MQERFYLFTHETVHQENVDYHVHVYYMYTLYIICMCICIIYYMHY